MEIISVHWDPKHLELPSRKHGEPVPVPRSDGASLQLWVNEGALTVRCDLLVDEIRTVVAILSPFGLCIRSNSGLLFQTKAHSPHTNLRRAVSQILDSGLSLVPDPRAELEPVCSGILREMDVVFAVVSTMLS
jgi:hypothetical protein